MEQQQIISTKPLSSGRRNRTVSAATQRVRAARQMATRRLRESERCLREVFEQAAVGIKRVDLKGVVVDVNLKFCEMLGYTKDELQGKSVREITHPEDYGKGAKYRAQLADGMLKSATTEKRFIHKNGSVVWTRRTISPICNDNGKPQHVISFVEDITASRTTQVKLEQVSRARRVMAECNHAIVHAGNEKWLLKEMCRIAVESGGYKQVWIALPGIDSQRLIYPAAYAGFGDESPLSLPLFDGSGHARKIADVIKSGRQSIERDILNDTRYEALRARASHFGYQSSLVLPLKSEGSILGGIEFNATEIDAFGNEEITMLTELANDIAFGISVLRTRVVREQAEVRSRESERRFQATFDQAAVGIVHTSLEGQYIRINRRFCEMLGYSEEELLGKTADFVTHPDDLAQSLVNRRALLTGEVNEQTGEKRYVRKDGSVIWARRTASIARDEAGKPLYSIRVIEDITASKTAEDRFHATFEQSAVGVAHTDTDGKFFQVNGKLCEIFGYSAEELLGMCTGDLTYAADRNLQDGMRLELLAGERQQFSGAKRIVRKDGKVLWINRTVTQARMLTSGEPYLIQVIEDITARKEIEENYRATFDNAPVGIMHTDADSGRILKVNRRLSEILGYSEEEFLGEITDKFSHPDYLGTDRARYRDDMRAGKISVFASERPFVRKDGSQVWVKRTTSLVRDANGKPLYYIRVVEDISERKQAEEAVTRERALLRTVVDNLPDRIYAKDREGRYVLQNMTNAKAHGVDSPDQLLGKTLFDIFPAHTAERVQKEDDEILASETPIINRERSFTDSSGKTKWVVSSKVPLRDAEGKIFGLVGVNRDITDRKQMEQTLAAERNLLSTLVNALPDLVFARDRDGKIQLVNEAWCRARGLAANDVIGKTVFDIHKPELAKQLDDEDIQVMETGVAVIDRARLTLVKSADGKKNEERWRATTKVPMRAASGEITGTVGISRDIHENRQSVMRREMEHAITRVLSESTSIQVAMPAILKTICEGLEWACGTHWHWDDDAQLLRCIETWHADAPELQAFAKASLNRTSNVPAWTGEAPGGFTGGGMIKKVWMSGAAVWCPDVMQQTKFLRAAVAANAGLGSGFGFPIVVSGKPLGVMEFYSRDIKEPDDALMQVIRSISSQIGQFIQRKQTEESLWTSKQRLALALNGARLALWDWDVPSDSVYLSEHWQTMVEGPTGQPAFTTFKELENLVHPDDVIRLGTHLKMVLTGELSQYDVEHRVRTRSGGWSWIHSQGEVVSRDASGRALRMAGTNKDINQRKEAERALRASEARYRDVFEASPLPMWVWDDETTNIFTVNQAAVDHYGYSREEFMRMTVRDMWVRDEGERYEDSIRDRAHQQVLRLQRKHRRKDGHVMFAEVTARRLEIEGRQVWMSVCNDITERKKAEESLVHLAHYDALTNLPNRVLFHDRLRQALAQAKRNHWSAGVVFIDVDRFKNINDTLGHAAGDQLLVQVSERLTRSVRANDTVGRLGGDEFAVVLAHLTRNEDAGRVAQKLMTCFTEPFILDGSEIFVTGSIGVAVYPGDSTDYDTLIKNADTAMYRTKERGRNGYQVYTPEMDTRSMDLLNLENSLRRALERNEFLLHYQPKVDVASGDVSGVEALLRWRHPERGLVSPADFIPVLEETGLIVQVGEWVLHTVCNQINNWKQSGIKPVPVAVNLSARQFLSPDLGSKIKSIIEVHGVDPRLIELEITESSLMVNAEEATRTLEYIQSLGVGISIDDFGTGYSSLGYLKRFPLTALKIDRSFVRDVTTDADDANITRAVISMAHSLGLKVVAEGVENDAQFAFLANYGCDQIQGFYFARPMPADDCGKWFSDRKRVTFEKLAA